MGPHWTAACCSTLTCTRHAHGCTKAWQLAALSLHCSLGASIHRNIALLTAQPGPSLLLLLPIAVQIMLLCAKTSLSPNMPNMPALNIAGLCCAQQTPPCMGMLGCFASRSGSPGFTMALMACLPTPFQASFCFRSASCTKAHALSDRTLFSHCQSLANQQHEGHEPACRRPSRFYPDDRSLIKETR